MPHVCLIMIIVVVNSCLLQEEVDANQNIILDWLVSANESNDRYVAKEILKGSVQFFHIYVTLFVCLALDTEDLFDATNESDKQAAMAFTNGWRLFTLGETTQAISQKQATHDAVAAVQQLQPSRPELARLQFRVVASAS